MPFEKGKSGNPNGRPPGKPNKVTGTIRDFVASLINENRDRIRKDIAGLEPKERLLLIERLLQYVIPKMASSTSDIRLEQLNDAELTSIASDILNRMNDEDTFKER